MARIRVAAADISVVAGCATLRRALFLFRPRTVDRVTHTSFSSWASGPGALPIRCLVGHARAAEDKIAYAGSDDAVPSPLAIPYGIVRC
jgi:hypothetical protein